MINNEDKKPWQSKTIWVSLITALAPLFPPVSAIVVAQPEIIGVLVGAVFAALRLTTDSKLKIK